MGRPGQECPNECEAANKQQVYEVKALLEVRPSMKSLLGREFLVKWRGYSSIWNSWEPEEYIRCPKLIDKLLSRGQYRLGIRKNKGSDTNESLDSLDSSATASNTICKRSSHTDSILVERLSRSKRPFRDSWNDILTGGNVVPFPGLKGHSSASRSKLERAILLACDSFARMMNSCGGAPITVENYVDFTPPPANFQCIPNLIYRGDVPLPDPLSLIGCQCQRGTGALSRCCTSSSCSCVGQGNRYRLAYSPTGRLLIEYGPIYECNSACACSSSGCSNRVIQRGRQVPLIIKRFAASKGWGVCAARNIPKGTFIDRYLGEVITAAESYRRSEPAVNWEVPEPGRYMFDLDFSCETGTESEFTVDAYAYGNVTHFLNHSCDPNVRVYPCFLDTQDPRLHQLAFFTSRNIQRGEELCFDYLGVTSKPHGGQAGSGGTLRCLCNSVKCRGYVY